MVQKIAVETLTLNEVSELFQKSIEISLPKSKGAIEHMVKKIRKAKKAEGLEQHKKLQREKDQKRKERKQVSLPAKHSKGKK